MKLKNKEMHTENTANQSLHDHCIVVKSIYILIMEILHGKQCLDCFTGALKRDVPHATMEWEPL